MSELEQLLKSYKEKYHARDEAYSNDCFKEGDEINYDLIEIGLEVVEKIEELNLLEHLECEV